MTDDSLSSIPNKNTSLFPANVFNSSVWGTNQNNATTPESKEEEDLTVLGVVIFLIRWLFGVIVEVGSLIPAWILILIAVVIFVRYMLMPLCKLLESVSCRLVTFHSQQSD